MHTRDKGAGVAGRLLIREQTPMKKGAKRALSPRLNGARRRRRKNASGRKRSRGGGRGGARARRRGVSVAGARRLNSRQLTRHPRAQRCEGRNERGGGDNRGGETYRPTDRAAFSFLLLFPRTRGPRASGSGGQESLCLPLCSGERVRSWRGVVCVCVCTRQSSRVMSVSAGERERASVVFRSRF